MKKTSNAFIALTKVFSPILILYIEGCNHNEDKELMIGQSHFSTPPKKDTVTYDIITHAVGGKGEKNNNVTTFLSAKERYNSLKINFENLLDEESTIDALTKTAIENLTNNLFESLKREAFENLNRFFDKMKKSNLDAASFECKECCNKILEEESSEFLLYPDEFMDKKHINSYTLHCYCMKQVAFYTQKDTLDIPTFALFDLDSFLSHIKDWFLITRYLYNITKYNPNKRLSDSINGMICFLILNRLEEKGEKLCAKTLDYLLGLSYEILHTIYKLKHRELLEVILFLTLDTEKSMPLQMSKREELFNRLSNQKTNPIFQLINNQVPLINIHFLWQAFEEGNVKTDILESFLKTFLAILNTIDHIILRELAIHYRTCTYDIRAQVEKAYREKRLDIDQTSLLLSCKDPDLVTKIIERKDLSRLSIKAINILIDKLNTNKSLLIVNHSHIEYLDEEAIEIINRMDQKKFKTYAMHNTDISSWTTETLNLANSSEKKKRIFNEKSRVSIEQKEEQFSPPLNPYITSNFDKNYSINKKCKREKASSIGGNKYSRKSERNAPQYIEGNPLNEDYTNSHMSTTTKNHKPRNSPSELKLYDVGEQSSRRLESRLFQANSPKSNQNSLSQRRTKKISQQQSESSFESREGTAYFGTEKCNQFESVYPNIESSNTNLNHNLYTPPPYYKNTNPITNREGSQVPGFIDYDTGRLGPNLMKPNLMNNNISYNCETHNSTYNYGYNKYQGPIENKFTPAYAYSRKFFQLRAGQIPVAANEEEQKKQEAILNLEEVRSMISELKDHDKYFFLRYLFTSNYDELRRMLGTSYKFANHQIDGFIHKISMNHITNSNNYINYY
jgi:hypothetical protein